MAAKDAGEVRDAIAAALAAEPGICLTETMCVVRSTLQQVRGQSKRCVLFLSMCGCVFSNFSCVFKSEVMVCLRKVQQVRGQSKCVLFGHVLLCVDFLHVKSDVHLSVKRDDVCNAVDAAAGAGTEQVLCSF